MVRLYEWRKEMCIPETNKPQQQFFNGTKIILPFNSESHDDIDFLENELKALDVHYLLFLSNINIIEWETPNAKGKYEKKLIENIDFVTLCTEKQNINYLVFDKTINIGEKNLKIKIAFELNAMKTAIVKCDSSPLFAFFPTAIETNLNFLVHAPFHTTESRETLDETDDRNEILQKELGLLFAEKINAIKLLNFINTEFINMLPIDESIDLRNPIYDIF